MKEKKSNKKVPKVKVDPMPTETFHGREIFLYSQAKEYSVTLKLVCTQATTRKQLIGWPPGASSKGSGKLGKELFQNRERSSW